VSETYKVKNVPTLSFSGGIVVLTDALVKLAAADEEVMALLAHELGHVDLRHVVRSVLQDSIVAAAATITADASTLSVAVAGLPMILARTTYSRKFESAADDYAFQLLKSKGYSPAAFADIMEKLDAHHGDRPAGFGYVSTHPLTEERIRRAREAA
jgi:predicted Zn-dependent protease